MIIYGRRLLIGNISYNKNLGISLHGLIVVFQKNRKFNISSIEKQIKNKNTESSNINNGNLKKPQRYSENFPLLNISRTSQAKTDSLKILQYEFDRISETIKLEYDKYFSIFYSKNFDYYLLSLSLSNKDQELIFEDSNKLFFFTKFNFLRSFPLKNKLAYKECLDELPFNEACMASSTTSLIQRYRDYLLDNGKDIKELYKLSGVLILKSINANQVFLNLLNLEILSLLKNKEFDILKSIIINIINLGVASFDTKPIKSLLTNIHHDEQITSQLVGSLKQFENNIEGYPEECKSKIALIANIINLFQDKRNERFIYNFIITFLIELNLSKYNYLAAASLALKYNINNKAILDVLINSLLVMNPKSDILTIDAVIKLVENLSYKLSMAQGINLFYKSLNLKLESPSILNNKIYSFLLKNFNEDKQFIALIKSRGKPTSNQSADLIKEFHNNMNFSSFINSSKELLMINVQNKNLASVYSIWMSLKELNVDWKILDVKLICSMVKSFRKDPAFKSVAYDIISSLPANIFKNSNIIQHLLDFSTDEKDLKLSKFLLKFVENPPPRILLRSLLKFFLANNDDESAQKILELIFNKSKVQFLPSEFNEIILVMLSKPDLFDRCYRLISFQEDIRIAKFSYISFLNFMVNNSESYMNVEIAEEFVYNLYRCYETELISFDNKRQLRYLSMIYVKYLLKYYDVATVLKIYQRSVLPRDSDIDYLDVLYFFKTGTQLVFNNEITSNYMQNINLKDFDSEEFSENFMFIPFGRSEEEIRNLRLYMPNEIKILALQSILQKAGQTKNFEVYLSATFELLNLGVSGMDVLISVSRKANMHLREVGLKLPIYDNDSNLYTADDLIEDSSAEYLNGGKLDVYKQLPSKYEQFRKFWEIEGHKITKSILNID